MKFKINITFTREFEIPANATDEEYDEAKAIAMLGMRNVDLTKFIKVERIDAPAEPLPKYEINKDCD
jgi:hypothetical protein